MKNMVKPLAVLSAAAVLGCTTGCSDTSWSLKSGDFVLTNGMYIYYTYIAYNEATTELSELYPDDDIEDIFEYEIDDKSTEEWIKDKAVEECVAQLTMDKLIEEYNVDINEEDLEVYEDYAEQWYQYGADFYEALGISDESYIIATGTYSGYSAQLFDAIYGEGGTDEVTEEEREAYFVENYTDYFYMYYSLTTTDDDGNEVSLDEDEIDEITTRFTTYANMINNGGKTTDDVEEQYEADFEEDSAPSTTGTAVLSSTSLDEGIIEVLDGLEEGQATTYTPEDDDTVIYVIYKGVIEDKLDTLEDETTLSSLLHTMKDDEYEEFLDEEEAELEYEINEACVSKYTVQRVVDIVNSYYGS